MCLVFSVVIVDEQNQEDANNGEIGFNLSEVRAMSESSSKAMIGRSLKRKQSIESLEHDHASSNSNSFCHDDNFPTSFHLTSRRTVRSRLFSDSAELSQPVLPGANTNKRCIAPNASESLFEDSQLSSSHSVRRRICLNPTEPQQPNSRLSTKRRPSFPLLESTTDFPNDFQFPSSRRMRSCQLQMSSEYQPTDSAEVWQDPQMHVPTVSAARPASSNNTHKHDGYED